MSNSKLKEQVMEQEQLSRKERNEIWRRGQMEEDIRKKEELDKEIAKEREMLLERRKKYLAQQEQMMSDDELWKKWETNNDWPQIVKMFKERDAILAFLRRSEERIKEGELKKKGITSDAMRRTWEKHLKRDLKANGGSDHRIAIALAENGHSAKHIAEKLEITIQRAARYVHHHPPLSKEEREKRDNEESLS